MKGLASLQEPRDLLAKLLHDLQRVRNNPTDVYAAFDFFVTAYHMLEWVYPLPPKTDPQHRVVKSQHKAVVRREPLLKVAEHLANNAKHYEAHTGKEVAQADVEGGWLSQRYVSPHWTSPSWVSRPRVQLTLTATGAALLDMSGQYALSALEAAEKLYSFWVREIQ